MATRKNSGDMMDYTPGADVTAGDVVVVGEIVGVALADIASGEKGALALEGIFEVACKSADVVTAGALLYWDATEGEATLTQGTNNPIGVATTAAADTVVLVDVKLLHVPTLD